MLNGEVYTAEKVILPGHGTFWFLREADGSGPLAPLGHCNGNGEITLEAVVGGVSYAHVGRDGVVRRFGKEIGRVGDFVPAVSR